MNGEHEPSGRPVEVRCYSGFKGEERPLSFTYMDRTLEVLEVERSWYEEDRAAPGGRRKACFRVRADDGSVYVLSRYEQEEQWVLERVLFFT